MSVSGVSTTLAKITTGLAVNTPYYLQVVTTSSNPAAPPKNASVLAPASALNAEIVELPASVVSWYKAEGNYLDTFGTNNGTATGVTFIPGEVGEAFDFDGSSNSNNVTAPTSGFPTGNASRTVEGWIRFDNIGLHTYQAVFAYGSGAATGDLFAVSLQGGQLIFDYQFNAVFGPTLTQGQIYHFAATYAAGVLTLYVNGASVASGSVALNTTAGTQLTIGQSPAAISTWGIAEMAGLVDELTVYNVALTPTQIQAIYTAGASGKQTRRAADRHVHGDGGFDERDRPPLDSFDRSRRVGLCRYLRNYQPAFGQHADGQWGEPEFPGQGHGAGGKHHVLFPGPDDHDVGRHFAQGTRRRVQSRDGIARFGSLRCLHRGSCQCLRQ